MNATRTVRRGAWFAIDDEARITDLDHGAEALLGVAAAEVLGRPCYEVVGGIDAAGRTACGPSCPALQALQQGDPSGTTRLRLPGRGEAEDSRPRNAAPYRCHLTALPGGHSGAVATLEPAEEDDRRANVASKQEAQGGGNGDVHRLTDHLAALAALPAALADGPSQAGLRRVLDLVRDTTGADVAELFLASPSGDGMVMTCHRGSHRREFMQRLRFETGMGLPGRVLSRGRPEVSAELWHDERYLRDRVKDAGFRSYVCAPLRQGGTVTGALGVAFRRDRTDLDGVLSFLHWACAPLAASLQAVLATHRDSLLAAFLAEGAPASGSRGKLERVLLEMVRCSGASSGDVRMSSYAGERQTAVPMAEVGTVPAAACPPLENGRLQDCPVLAEARTVTLYGRRASWPAPCRSLPRKSGVCTCTPLVARGVPVGVARLWHDSPGTDPPTKDLVAIERMADVAARAVQDERTQGTRGRRELYHLVRRAEANGAPDAGVEAGTGPLDGQEHAPHVEVACFGSFALHVGGVSVDPRRVRRKKTLTLLKILLAYRGAPVSKDVLIENLWREGDPVTKSGQLYVLVHELRRLLGCEEGDRDHVRRDGDRYFVEPASSLRVDVWEFERLVRMADEVETRGEVGAALAAGEEAAALYRGDFMADDAYAEWCWQERAWLRETFLDLLIRLAGWARTCGEVARGVAYLRRAVALDPLRESAHRALMETLWAAGMRDAAVRQYQACEEVLRRELGVGPLPETTRLLERIRVQERPEG